MPRGNSIPFSGFAHSELFVGAATVPVVIQKDAGARSDDRKIAGAHTNAAEDTTAGRSGVGTTASGWSGVAGRNSLERGVGSLH